MIYHIHVQPELLSLQRVFTIIWCEVLPSLSVSLPVSLPQLPHSLFPSPPLPLSQSVTAALLSLKMVYPRRNLPAEQWRSAQLLSLLSAPAAMLDPACCDTVSPPSRHLSSCIYLLHREEERERGSGVMSEVWFFQWCQAQTRENMSQLTDAITVYVLLWRSDTVHLTLVALCPP